MISKEIVLDIDAIFGAILAIAGRSYIEIVLDIDAILIQSCMSILYQNYCISFWFYGNRLGSLGSRGV